MQENTNQKAIEKIKTILEAVQESDTEVLTAALAMVPDTPLGVNGARAVVNAAAKILAEHFPDKLEDVLARFAETTMKYAGKDTDRPTSKNQ